MLLGYERGPKDRTVAVIGPGRPIESQRLVPFVLFAYETENVRVILQRCTCFSYDGIPIPASLIGFEEMERGACRWQEIPLCLCLIKVSQFQLCPCPDEHCKHVLGIF